MPIPILQYGVKVRDPTTKQFSDLAALRGGQGPQGAAGPGVPTGGADGDVLVKDGATDYSGKWTSTPPQMGSFARINATSAAETTYYKDDYLVYDGELYRVTTDTISQGVTLNPGQGGNIQKTSVADILQGPIQSKSGSPNTASFTASKNVSTLQYPTLQRYGTFAYVFARCVIANTLSANELLFSGVPRLTTNAVETIGLQTNTGKALRIQIDGSGNVRNFYNSLASGDAVIIAATIPI